MDAAAHYKGLVRLGRQEFLAAAAPAMLLRHVLHAWPPPVPVQSPITEMLAEDVVTNKVEITPVPRNAEVQVYPLAKKPGAAFPDMITIGRTANNDVVLSNHSISRLHLYVSQRDNQWWAADNGSKNGSWLGAERLSPRKEVRLFAAATLRLGELQFSFHLASEAYYLLGGQ
ncbi:MAG TPA: FHA domain-containing protein [Kofleriaceae bacterium]|nr:FHA domain-containing protein [Kofleriaceae bacterium]